MSILESGPRLTDPRIETWVLVDGPRPMVAQLRRWARGSHAQGPRAVLVEVGWAEDVSWPVFALVGRLATILRAQQSALGIVINEAMRERCQRVVGLGDEVPVFSGLDDGLEWAQGWLDPVSPS